MRDLLDKIVDVIVTNKIGSIGQNNIFFYPLNYGKLSSNEEIEVYILGQYKPLESFKGKIVAVVKRVEEQKLVVVVTDPDDSYTFKQIRALIEFQERLHKSAIYTAGNISNNSFKIKVLGLVYRDQEILVERFYDLIKDETFYRCLGGGVHFREKSQNALIREFKEEINTEVQIISHKATIENIFTFGHSEHHELDIIYEIKIDDHFYKNDTFSKTENKEVSDVYWIDKKKFLNEELIMYPKEILKYL